MTAACWKSVARFQLCLQERDRGPSRGLCVSLIAMDQQLRDRSVDEHQELFGDQLVPADAPRSEVIGEPVLEGAFVISGQVGDTVVGMVTQLTNGACERAAMPARVLRLLREEVEESFDLSDHIAIDAVDRRDQRGENGFVLRLKIGCNQLVLGFKVFVERALGNVGLGRNEIDADRANALRIEQLARGGEDTGSRFFRSAASKLSHARPTQDV